MTARAVLESAEWQLPVALVMQQADVARDVAQSALHDAGNSVMRAVAQLTSEREASGQD
jgi:NACalpha-BTF3-like transcription factor